MQLVVDTNILFSFFWSNSLTKKILMNPNLKLFSPQFSIIELKKYSKEIISRAKIDESLFNSLLNNLESYITFVDEKNYMLFADSAKKISPDLNDFLFIALALKLKIPIWSNDKILKTQDNVDILTTQDILDVLTG